MGTIFVDNLEPQSGTSLTLGASGDTVGLASGASQTLAVMTPAFHAYRSDAQSISQNTWTKVELNAEEFDSASAFDTSNNRFTPQTAGKYYIYGSCNNGASLQSQYVAIYLNGSKVLETQGDATYGSIYNCAKIITFNGSSDYIELYTYYQSGSVSTSHNQGRTFMGGYKIIGA